MSSNQLMIIANSACEFQSGFIRKREFGSIVLKWMPRPEFLGANGVRPSAWLGQNLPIQFLACVLFIFLQVLKVIIPLKI